MDENEIIERVAKGERPTIPDLTNQSETYQVLFTIIKVCFYYFYYFYFYLFFFLSFFLSFFFNINTNKDCWFQLASKRPTFEDLAIKLGVF